MDSKDSLSSDCVFVHALAGGILCMKICVCRACVCVLHVLIKKCPVVNTAAGWDCLCIDKPTGLLCLCLQKDQQLIKNLGFIISVAATHLNRKKAIIAGTRPIQY